MADPPVRRGFACAVSFLALPLAGVLAAGCAQEMFKATPFASGEYELTQGLARDRVNLWPLYYHRAPATSFLWPIGEKTDTTWAIRPIVASYGRKLDLFWPLLHWDFENHAGHLFPFYFQKGPGDYTLFPILRRDQDGWLTPLYGRGRDGASGSWTYTPLWYASDDGRTRTTIVPPLLSRWRTFGEDGGWDADFLFGVGGVERTPRGSGEHLYPIYWREKGGGKSTFGLLPFYAEYEDRLVKFSAIPPLLSARYEEDAGKMGWSASPVAVQTWSPSQKVTVIPPLLCARAEAPETGASLPLRQVDPPGPRGGQGTGRVPADPGPLAPLARRVVRAGGALARRLPVFHLRPERGWNARLVIPVEVPPIRGEERGAGAQRLLPPGGAMVSRRRFDLPTLGADNLLVRTQKTASRKSPAKGGAGRAGRERIPVRVSSRLIRLRLKEKERARKRLLRLPPAEAQRRADAVLFPRLWKPAPGLFWEELTQP